MPRRRSSRAKHLHALLLLLVNATAGSPTPEQEPVSQLESKVLYREAKKDVQSGAQDRALERFYHLIHRYPDSQLADLARDDVARIRHLEEKPPVISSSARTGLVSFATLYGTGLGVGTGILAESSSTVFGLGFIAGPTVGIVSGLNRTRDARISDGQASLVALGGTWGAWQGIGSAILLNADEKVTTGAGMIGSTAGLVAARWLIGRTYVTTAEANLIIFGGVWGTWFALSGVKAAGGKGTKPPLASALIGGNVGLMAAALGAQEARMSTHRVRLINLGGIVGVLYGLGAAVLGDLNDQTRPTFGLMFAGGLAGLAAGAYLTRDYDGTQNPLFGATAYGSSGERGERFGWKPPRIVLRPTPAPSPEAAATTVDLSVDLIRLTM